MKAKQFEVEVSRKVDQVGSVMITETSPRRAMIVAEYEAKVHPDTFDWDSEVVNPTQLKSKVIED